jgi:hypothetical protein
MADTKPENVKYCSKCNINKNISDFREKRFVCKSCDNENKRLKYNDNKELRDKRNEKRKEKYKTDEEHRKKLIKHASEFKHNKVIEKQKLKEEENLKIGLENKQCKYCNETKLKTMFRHNRLKCRDCERDEPLDKFKRKIRCRIYLSLKKKNKHTIEYLGCSTDEYLKWMLHNNNGYSLDNQGTIWHIDHVIPLSHFDLENEDEQMIAFNWRNTMPLSVKENLSKNNKIIKSQIEQHYENLVDYHTKNNIELPQVYIDLFATHSN